MSNYRSGKLGALARLTASLVKADPTLADDFGRLKATLFVNMPELADKSCCANCGASMKEYVIRFDYWQAILLLAMGRAVRERQRQGMDFTVANQVRVPELDVSLTAKCKTTQASKLGLVVQLRNENKVRVDGVWVITKRGWDALRGYKIPASVVVFRKEIVERHEAKTTLEEAFQAHGAYAEAQRLAGKASPEDYREFADSYKPTEWTGMFVEINNMA